LLDFLICSPFLDIVNCLSTVFGNSQLNSAMGFEEGIEQDNSVGELAICFKRKNF